VAPAPPPPAVPHPLAAAAPAAPTCEALALQGALAEAVACHLRRADGGGLAGELSLFEAGRLRRDRLDDAAGALELFRAYRARFPRGALRAEADLAVVGLLPRLGRYPEALEELTLLLSTPAGRERRAELELLRGNVYREGMGDCARAERAYETAAASGPGDRTDQARLYRGTCLETLGRPAEAAALYQQLAAHPGKYAALARARLDQMAGAAPKRQ
jgi:tetratricopeptide (TPR) repeat protein